MPRGTNDIREFVNLAFPAQSKIQQLIQQGYELGTEIDVLDDNNEPTGEMIRLDIANTDEFGALQARLYDTKEKLPESERPDLTEIKIGIEFFDHEIIDYDMLVELLNNFMDEKQSIIEKRLINILLQWMMKVVKKLMKLSMILNLVKLRNTSLLKRFNKSVRKDGQIFEN